MRFVIFLSGLVLFNAVPGQAETTVLVIGNAEYQNLDDVRHGTRPTIASESLNRSDVFLTRRTDADTAELNAALSEYATKLDASDTQLIVLSGRFLSTPTETFFMATDAEGEALHTLPQQGLPLSTVFAWQGQTQGRSLLILATDDTDVLTGPSVRSRVGKIDLPQGVTLVAGSPRQIESFLKNLGTPNWPLVKGAREAGLQIAGYAPEDLFLLAAESQAEASTAKPEQAEQSDSDRVRDITDWRNADSKNTVDAYEAYIAAHPDGTFVAQAQDRIGRLTDTPELLAEDAEKALELTSEQRHEIQRMLTLLDYNTRGIDGIFGRGTRAAISSWQESQGFVSTGFLNRDQIIRLDAQAERRAAELEAEAERRRAEQLAADVAFWEETGAIGDEAGLRAYLNRYPDGEFAEDAQEQLDAIERQKRRGASARDRELWDQASMANTAEAYRDYLRLAPDGAFRDEAITRLAALEEAEETAQRTSAAAREEEALRLSTRTKRTIEARLDSLGLRPGRVDGVFDDDTRHAIRRYQAARDLEETGYVSEAMVVRLLADSVRRIFR